MIIKFTVNDNDFYDILMRFGKSLPVSLWVYTEDTKIREINYIRNIINPNSDIKLTDSNKRKLIERVREQFNKFINTAVKDVKTREYLSESFKVSIVNTLTDKWENGEMFYWLQHSNTLVNQ